MAESTERRAEELPEGSEHLEVEAAKEKRGGRKWIVLGVLALVLSGGGAFLSYAYYGEIATMTSTVLMEVGIDGGEDAEVEDEPLEYGVFTEIEGIVINPASTSGQRYLMVNIGLESANQAILDEVSGKEIVVRDTVLKILGSQSVEDLVDISRRNELKEMLRSAVNDILDEGEVDRLYFTRYVLQ